MADPMTTRTPSQALAEVIALSEKATPGPWLYRCKSNTFHRPPPEGTAYSYGESIMDADEDYPTFKDGDVDFILAAVNFIREHGRHFAGLEAEVGRLREYEQVAGMLAIEKAELRRAAQRVIDAFNAHGKSRGIVDDARTRNECEASMVALNTALGNDTARAATGEG